MGRVDGKIAFITGAARGQGRSHAIRLAQEGADIIAVDLCEQIATVEYPMATPEDLAETVKEVEALDRRIVATQADVRDQAALKAVLDDGVAQLGRVDIVLANAGIAPMGADERGPDRVLAGHRRRQPHRRLEHRRGGRATRWSSRAAAGRSCSPARPPGSRASAATPAAGSATPPASTASSASCATLRDWTWPRTTSGSTSCTPPA